MVKATKDEVIFKMSEMGYPQPSPKVFFFFIYLK
jgi:hypothetical protein